MGVLVAAILVAIFAGSLLYLVLFLRSGTRGGRNRRYRRYAAERADRDTMRERYERERERP